MELTFKEYITEGGAFGHLSHPYDVNMKFSDMFGLIHDSLNGKLDYAEEKTDGTNMLFTVKNGKILFARNKGHLKKQGENAMGLQEVKTKFAGRDIGDAYAEALTDLQSAVDKLSKKQQDFIFFQGRAWMSVEVIGVGSTNIIPYGISEIRFHGTSEYDDDGVKSTDINKKNAKILEGMLKQRQAQQQRTYHISNLSRSNIPRLPNFKQLESQYVGKVKGMLSKFGMSAGNTINDYKEAYWMSIIDKRDLPDHVKKALVNRWAHFKKSVTIAKISKELDDKDKKWVKALEKDQLKISADAMKPLKDVFLRLGQDVINQMTDVMALNPDKAVQEITKKIESSVSKIKDSGNTGLIKKLEAQLTRLQSVENQVLPTEGLTFFYTGSNKERHFLKLTGSFAPVNSLINLVWQL